MTANSTGLRFLVEAELAAIADPLLRERVRSLLLEPSFIRCSWDYGERDQTFPCWRVARDPQLSGVGVVYCEHGFGPERPWGLVWLDEAVPSMGMDCGWFATFREAIADILDIPPARLNVCQGP
jgi:hypothetical protein